MSSSRFDLEIASNKDSLKMIANLINQQLHAKLDMTQLADLLQYIRGQRIKNWTNMSRDDICKFIARTFLSSRFTETGRANLEPEMIDIHEILKARVNSDKDIDNIEDITPAQCPTTNNTINAQTTSIMSIDGIIGKTDEVGIQKLFNPKAAYRKNYIFLDTRYRDTSDDSGNSFTSMSWIFLANSATTSPGGVNSLGDIQQVVAMTTGDIRLPYQNNAMINSYRRISMNINEWSGQSFIGQESRKFHFMFKAATDGNMIDCTTLLSNAAQFEFARPITQLDRITVTFGCPLEPIAFDMDRQLMTISYLANAQFTAVNPHNLQTGDQIYISNFTTNDLINDIATITAVNRTIGYNIVVINPLVIQVTGLDLSTVNAIIPLNVTVFFGSKRIFIPLELTYIAKPLP